MAVPIKPPRGNRASPLLQDALVREFRDEAEKAGGQITNRLRLDQEDKVQTEDEPVNWIFEWKNADS